MSNIVVHTTPDVVRVGAVSSQPIKVTAPRGLPGPPGPPGAAAKWEEMTQAEYNALPTKDPNTLYVIIG